MSDEKVGGSTKLLLFHPEEDNNNCHISLRNKNPHYGTGELINIISGHLLSEKIAEKKHTQKHTET